MKFLSKLGITLLLAVFTTGMLWAQHSDAEIAAKMKTLNYGITKTVIGGGDTDADIIAVGSPMSSEQILNAQLPLQTKNPKSITEEIDIVGGNSTGYSNPNRCRGNGFLCTESMILKEFMAWHSVTDESTQMWMTVYEGDTPQGDYSLVSATDISPAPVGVGWCSSGEIDFTLEAGKYYLLLSSFEQECGYYCEQAVNPFPYPVTFGEAIGGAGAGWSPSCNFPPDETQSVFGAWEVNTFYYQQIITEYLVTYDDDLGIKSLVSPVSGASLTTAEAVTIEVKNYGTVAHSDISVSYTLDGGTPVVETVSGTLNGGETIEHTFAETVDLSAFGTYEIEVCIDVADENPDNDCELEVIENLTLSYCSASTTSEDEYISNVLCGTIDNASGWQSGVADYTAISTEIEAGTSEDITVSNGNPYATDEVIAWVDWNNDFEFEIGGNEEFVLTSDGTGASFTGAITVPNDATNGVHRMRVRLNYGGAPVPCGTSAYGEVEDYSITVVGGVIGALLEEDFNGYFFANGWSVVGLGQSNWDQSQSNNAGGVAAEVEFYWTPTFTGNSKLVSPVVSTSGANSLVLEFKHMVDYYSSSFLIAVETTSDGTTWNEVWSTTVTGEIAAETVLFEIENADVGSDNFQIAFTFDGSSIRCESWCIDDVILVQSFGTDVAAVETNIPTVLSAGNAISPIGKVLNVGSATATFDVTLDISENGTSVYSDVQTVTDLANLEEAEVTFPDWTPSEGNFDITLTTSLTGDENPGNDVVTELVQVAETLYEKKPLFEIFTSSTCTPCVLGNIVVDSILEKNEDKYTLIKHQMNWPGVGDPYFTAEAGARGDYYNIYVVPSLFVDAVDYFPLMDYTQELFDESQGKETGLGIEITQATIDDNNLITISTDLLTKANYAAGLSCHVVVTEKTTYNNTGTNGETEFYHVMMKMLPDASGEILGELVADVPTTLTYSYDMNLTFMETPDDLSVVVFVQDDTDRSVLQSATIDVTVGTVLSSEAEILAFSFDEQVGDAVIDAGAQTVKVDVPEGTDVTALIATFDISASATVAVAGVTQVSGTTPNDFTIPVDYTVEAEDGTTKVWSVTVDILTRVDENLQDKVRLYPNPASDVIIIESQLDIQKIEVYNQVGQLVKVENTQSNRHSLNVSDLNTGVYFVKLFSHESVISKSFVVK